MDIDAGMIARVWFAVFGESLEGRKVQRGEVRVLCPFHLERSPSCDVHLAKNSFICRSCGAAGGCLDVVVKSGNASDRREAASWLKARGVLRG